MKIALVREKVHRFGGAEKNVVLLAEGLLKERHEVHIFAASWDEPVPGAVYHRVKSGSLLPFLKPVVFARRVAKAISKVRPDLVFSFDRIFAPDVYRAGDGCHIEWMRRLGEERGLFGKILIRLSLKHRAILYLERRLFTSPRLKQVITNSRMVKEEIVRNYGTPAGKITVVYNGVERVPGQPRAAAKDALRRELGFTPDDYLVLFAGSNYERKGLRYLIEAIKGMPQAKILVVGKGDERKYRRIARKDGVGKRVHFYGMRKDLDRFYAAADIFVLPTLYDPFSNVTLEAMSYGLPVITTHDNGASEIMEDDLSELVMRADVVGRGLTLLENNGSRERFSRACLRVAQHYDVNGFVRKTVQVCGRSGAT